MLTLIPQREKKATSKLAASVSPLAFSQMSHTDTAAERDSPRDQLVVTLFLLTVFGLLLGAGIKNRMLKAGFDTNLTWSNSRRWWEVCYIRLGRLFLLFSHLHAPQAWVPSRQMDEIGLGNRLFSRSNGRSRGEYENVPGSPAA